VTYPVDDDGSGVETQNGGLMIMFRRRREKARLCKIHQYLWKKVLPCFANESGGNLKSPRRGKGKGGKTRGCQTSSSYGNTLATAFRTSFPKEKRREGKAFSVAAERTVSSTGGRGGGIVKN